jgi:hypothetical protein
MRKHPSDAEVKREAQKPNSEMRHDSPWSREKEQPALPVNTAWQGAVNYQAGRMRSPAVATLGSGAKPLLTVRFAGYCFSRPGGGYTAEELRGIKPDASAGANIPHIISHQPHFP